MNTGTTVAAAGTSTQRLGPQHREQLLQHLLSLDAEDRGRRFMLSASDGYVQRYATGIDFDRGIVMGAFVGDQLGGVAHAALEGDGADAHFEVGLSVARSDRRRGVGRKPLRECVARGLQDAPRRVVVRYQPGNAAMGATARSLDSAPQLDAGEMRAEFGPGAPQRPPTVDAPPDPHATGR